ncbi:type II DNA modification methyltransferase [Lentisphaera araneosa HTCC2155]|uniref:site-specific DNA-methyltransferase (adenine-specific) n=1 Tax=Lentisphaera araneosa HTCC2155 TaxID=313628 RepID=A6DR30_9BACT|nr:TaqI-like C-terminal specificity domain-containing protein [Lentisphaera araneosa]EDM25918.1 type II DNA modification methyltransferase [Lentisphaera araneosa HTCC2155]
MRTSQKPQGHKSLAERKATGAHYTPKALADFMARQVFDFWSGKSKDDLVTVLEPAVGDGQLIQSLLDVLIAEGYLNIQVVLYDTDTAAIKCCQQILERAYPKVKFTFYERDFLADFLAKKRKRKYDLVIGNPPYVRTQEMGADASQELAREFALSGCVDLSHAFILAVGKSLKKTSKFTLLISNRLLSLKGAWAIREHMRKQFAIDHLWDFGDSKLFKAAVLPLVFVAGLGRQKQVPPFTSIYEEKDLDIDDACERELFDNIDKDGLVNYQGLNLRVSQGDLDFGEGLQSRWTQKTILKDGWLKEVERHTFGRFGDINKISVGIKSTADKVFIKQDWLGMSDDERPEMLMPLITHFEADQYTAEVNPSSFVLYTHETRDGEKRVIELDDYPKTKTYLEANAQVLKARKYLQESKTRRWYEVWVAHDPAKWQYPKIVFRDISAKPLFWLDESGAVVNGDCYWMSSQGLENLDLIYLALAVGNSSFIEKFYDANFHNKLYSGRRRFITQYVKEFPLPDPKTEGSKMIIELVKKTYESGVFDDEVKKQISDLVDCAFNVADLGTKKALKNQGFEVVGEGFEPSKA